MLSRGVGGWEARCYQAHRESLLAHRLLLGAESPAQRRGTLLGPAPALYKKGCAPQERSHEYFCAT